MKVIAFFTYLMLTCYCAELSFTTNEDMPQTAASKTNKLFSLDTDEIFNKKKQGLVNILSEAKPLDVNMNSINDKSERASLPSEYVDAYDWTQQAQEKNCMVSVPDQGTCGSCYAMAITAVFSIRKCISTYRQTQVIQKVEYSAQDLVSCSTYTFQCQGGNTNIGFKFLEDVGVVQATCQPYTEGGTTGASVQNKCNTASCTGSGSFSKSYCKKGSTTVIFGIDRIKYEILNWGPIATSMEAYEDLYDYHSGVYKHKTGASLGGHAVVIVGWGMSVSTPYWIVLNSWGSSWGMNGYFNIDMADMDSKLGELTYYCIPK